MIDLTYEQALTKVEHLKALGITTVYLRDERVPWVVADDVEVSGAFRFNGPCGMYVMAKVEGITFKWSVDFEQRDANGMGYSLFDRERLREVAMKLPYSTRRKFARLLRDRVMPDLQKRTEEMRQALNKQIDSEDCVRGLIAFADECIAA